MSHVHLLLLQANQLVTYRSAHLDLFTTTATSTMTLRSLHAATSNPRYTPPSPNKHPQSAPAVTLCPRSNPTCPNSQLATIRSSAKLWITEPPFSGQMLTCLQCSASLKHS